MRKPVQECLACYAIHATSHPQGDRPWATSSAQPQCVTKAANTYMRDTGNSSNQVTNLPHWATTAGVTQVNYFYRLSDLESTGVVGEKRGPWSKQQKKNRTAWCDALVKMGIVETNAAAEALIKKEHSGTSRASRLLNRFVSVSICFVFAAVLSGLCSTDRTLHSTVHCSCRF